MKKNYLWIAAAAVMFAACSSNDTFKDVDVQETPIAFTSYAQPTTKATENNDGAYSWNLEDHHTSFDVWGYRKKSDTYQWVFTKQNVTYSSSTWSYTPVRYWDKTQDSYTFFAAAPDHTNWNISNGALPADQKLSYAGLTLSDHDATTADATASADNYVESFSTAAPGKDLMIAAPCTTSDYANPVNLQFIHILSRLNVIVQRGNKLNANDVVNITSFQVCGFLPTGDFDESLHAADNQDGTMSRWKDQTGTKINYTSSTAIIDPSTPTSLTVTNDGTSNTKKQYILQSLVIPQNVTYQDIAWNVDPANINQAYIHITYTISNTNWPADSQTESYEGYYNLAKALGADGTTTTTKGFYEGWQNNLTLKINPALIEFDPTVSTWGTKDYEFEIN